MADSSRLIEPDVVGRVLVRARAHGASWAELFVEDRDANRVAFEDGGVTGAASMRSSGASVRVQVGDRQFYASTEDLSPEGLLRAADAAAEAASAGRDTPAPVRPPRHRGGRPSRDGYIDPPGSIERPPSAISPEERRDLLTAMDDAARSVGAAIVQVSSACTDVVRRILVANSDGLDVATTTTRVSLFLEATAKGDTGLQTAYVPIGRTTGFEAFDVDVMRRYASDVARTAIVKLGAVPAPADTLPVVIAPGQGAFLFHEACGHSLELDLVRRGASPFAGRLGERVASRHVTLVDHGGVPGENGASAIDDEGVTPERTVLIRDGILESYLRDRTEAGFAGQSSTGNGRRESYNHRPQVRMTNTFLEAGTDSPEDILASTQRGVYVVGLGGGEVNAVGDFVFGTTEAYLIENGEVTRPLRDANLIGNGPAALAAIDAVGNDFAMGPGMCGKGGQTVPVGVGQPTLRVAALTVGGTGR